ncbi:PAS domain S-box protein [Krasilnikovia sp. MM14-A1259]|uniref:PAS domain S-box protein n=1 Tax=Krasilnikovia sp. MM14-A1259 TaxID=3373539 RepID=UPI00381EF9D7
MQTLRRVRIGVRLGGAFGFVALLLIVMIGIAVDNTLAQRDAHQQAAESAALQRDALTAKFRIADINGWQTGYAFDTVRGVPNATDDAIGQRRAFLASAAAFRQDLARLAALPLTAEERRQLITAEDAFTHFMDLDARIVSGYRSGVPAKIAEANNLVAGEALQWFVQTIEAVDQLAAQAGATADADDVVARSTNSRALTVLIAVGIACLLLAVVLALLATRTVAATARHKAVLAAIVEQSADATVAVNLDGTITAWNSGAQRIYGYRPDEVIGHHVTMLLPPHRDERAANVLAALAAGHEYHIDGASRRRKDGSEVIVSTALWPIRNENGVVIGGAATERDITVRKQQEAEQKLADEQAARAARLESLGHLAGGVAHDFNNLLAIILSSAEFIPDETEEVAKDLARIRGAAERARDLTSQLLLFAKREPTQVEIVDLNLVVADAHALLVRTIGANITLRCHTAPTAVLVRANRGRLDQILLNLVINARDAMPHGGVVNIESDTSERPEGPSQLLPPGYYAQLSVSDNGTGMSAEVKDRLFEPFFTTKPSHQGTGLGLATVYGIVTDARGTIEVDSAPGVGTTFRVLLPIAAWQDDASTESPVAPTPGHGERVLVVEDEEAVREVVVRILNRNGYRTTAVGDADSALRTDLHDVALLITDMMLPDRSGVAIADELHARYPDMPVLFMTGSGEAPVWPASGTNDATCVVNKPFTAAELLSNVGKTLAGTAGRRD